MSAAERFRCSDAARERGDRMVGTAPPARRWFLVEQGGAWGPTAWAGLDVTPEVAEALQAALDPAGARLQLIRRPGRPEDPGRTARHWCVVDMDWERPVLWGEARDEAGLVEAAHHLGGPCPEGAVLPGGPGIVLVCTHGRKDVCCAVRGRPVASSLASLWPEETWETTHTGGDRFAANVVLLPDGAVYGGTDPGTAVSDLTAHTAGQVDPTRLRGRCGEEREVQVARAAVLERLGPMPWGAVKTDGAVQRRGDGSWQAELRAGRTTATVTGHLERTEPHHLTCRAVDPAPMELAVVDDVTLRTGATD